MESYGYNVKPVVRWFSMNSKVFVSKFHTDHFSGWEKVKVSDHSHDVSVRSQQLFSLGHESGAVHLVVVALPPCCQPGQTTSTKNLRSKVFVPLKTKQWWVATGVKSYTNCFRIVPYRKFRCGTSAAEVMLRALGDHAIPKLARFKVSAPCVFHVFPVCQVKVRFIQDI